MNTLIEATLKLHYKSVYRRHIIMEAQNSTAVENGSFIQETPITEGDGWLWDDATWILCASFIIFTMQTGKTG
jgi:hypothetical protein